MRLGEVVGSVGTRLTARTIAAAALHVEALGLEHIPNAGPVLLAVRHFHHLYDGASIVAAIPRHVRILVALDWATSTEVRRAMEALCALAGWPVVLRRPEVLRSGTLGAYAPQETLARTRAGVLRAVAVLREGGVLAVFPEGYPAIDPHRATRSATDVLPFAAGILTIARRAARTLRRPIPIVPVGLHYGPAGGRVQVVLRCGTPRYVVHQERGGLLLEDLRRDVLLLSGLRDAV